MTGTSGKLLIAEPMLGDPNFERTVVLVVEHADEGALGLVLNRPSDVPVREALPEWGVLASEPGVVHVGGPVEGQSGWCLARLRATGEIVGFVPLVGDLGLLDLSIDPDPLVGHLSAARFYAGYSGWGAGQLDEELSLDAWYVVDADPGDPFHLDSESLWRQILSRQGGDLARLSTFPPHPSLN